MEAGTEHANMEEQSLCLDETNDSVEASRSQKQGLQPERAVWGSFQVALALKF